eukprot:Gb_27015 [translate_table: standard]
MPCTFPQKTVQQRIFSVQVFELHRLIKVQQLIATSPNLLIEDNSHLNAPIGKANGEKPSSDYPIRNEVGKDQNTEVQKTFQATQNAIDPAVGQLAQPAVGCHQSWFNKGTGQISSYDPQSNIYSGTSPSIPIITPGETSTWGLHDPGLGFGQWMIPMISSSGGMMYQPFSGTLTGFIVGTPSTVTASQGSNPQEFVSSYGLPTSTQQWGGAFFPTVPAPNSFPSWNSLPIPLMDPMHRPEAHGIPVITAHNRVSQEKVAPSESAFRNACFGQTIDLTSMPRLGSFPHQHRQNPSTKQSHFLDSNIYNSQANQIACRSNMHSQNSCSVSNQTREGNNYQVWGKVSDLTGASQFNVMNNPVGEHFELQRTSTINGAESTSKRFEEAVMSTHREGHEKCEGDKIKTNLVDDTLPLFPLAPSLESEENSSRPAEEHQSQVIKVVPLNAMAAPESAARIFLSIQQERQQ